MYICFNIKVTQTKWDSECHENYVWIYAHANDLDQGVV